MHGRLYTGLFNSELLSFFLFFGLAFFDSIPFTFLAHGARVPVALASQHQPSRPL